METTPPSLEDAPTREMCTRPICRSVRRGRDRYRRLPRRSLEAEEQPSNQAEQRRVMGLVTGLEGLCPDAASAGTFHQASTVPGGSVPRLPEQERPCQNR